MHDFGEHTRAEQASHPNYWTLVVLQMNERIIGCNNQPISHHCIQRDTKMIRYSYLRTAKNILKLVMPGTSRIPSAFLPSVSHISHSENPHNRILRRECFLYECQIKVLKTYFAPPRAVKALRKPCARNYASKFVVAQPIQEAIKNGLRCHISNRIFTLQHDKTTSSITVMQPNHLWMVFGSVSKDTDF